MGGRLQRGEAVTIPVAPHVHLSVAVVALLKRELATGDQLA